MVVYFKVVNSTSIVTMSLLFQPARVSEIHAMVSATKPLVTWTCRDAIQECREACGGHGYLKGFLLICLSCVFLCFFFFFDSNLEDKRFCTDLVKSYQSYKNPDDRDGVGLWNDALLEPNARLSTLEDLILCSRIGSNEECPSVSHLQEVAECAPVYWTETHNICV